MHSLDTVQSYLISSPSARAQVSFRKDYVSTKIAPVFVVVFLFDLTKTTAILVEMSSFQKRKMCTNAEEEDIMTQPPSKKEHSKEMKRGRVKMRERITDTRFGSENQTVVRQLQNIVGSFGEQK